MENGSLSKIAVILNRTPESDQELLNIFESYGNYHQNIGTVLVPPAAKKLNELISLLKKEYHLK